jgi:hypothetical protein
LARFAISAQVVTSLQHSCSNAVPTTLVNRMCLHCLFPACCQFATRLFSSTDFLQVVIVLQQFVNKLLVTTLYQLDKITALLQLVEKLSASLLRTHLVDKL